MGSFIYIVDLVMADTYNDFIIMGFFLEASEPTIVD